MATLQHNSETSSASICNPYVTKCCLAAKKACFLASRSLMRPKLLLNGYVPHIENVQSPQKSRVKRIQWLFSILAICFSRHFMVRAGSPSVQREQSCRHSARRPQTCLFHIVTHEPEPGLKCQSRTIYYIGSHRFAVSISTQTTRLNPEPAHGTIKENTALSRRDRICRQACNSASDQRNWFWLDPRRVPGAVRRTLDIAPRVLRVPARRMLRHLPRIEQKSGRSPGRRLAPL